MNETKHDRFLRQGKTRTQRAVRAIAMVERCANRASNDYTVDEAEKVVAELEAAVAKARKAFEPEAEFEF